MYSVFNGHKRIIDLEDTARTLANIVDNFILGEAYNVRGKRGWEKEIKDYSDLIVKAVGRDDSQITYNGCRGFHYEDQDHGLFEVHSRSKT